MIVWKIHLDEEGTTTPVLDLLPKIPEQGNLSHSRDCFWAARPWCWAASLSIPWNSSYQRPNRQTHLNSAPAPLHPLCNFQGLTNPVCLQLSCFTHLLSALLQLLENNLHCSVFPAVLEQRMTSVESIPSSFRSALRLFGIEAAIENLIKVLGSEEWMPALLTPGSNFKSSFN